MASRTGHVGSTHPPDHGTWTGVQCCCCGKVAGTQLVKESDRRLACLLRVVRPSAAAREHEGKCQSQKDMLLHNSLLRLKEDADHMTVPDLALAHRSPSGPLRGGVELRPVAQTRDRPQPKRGRRRPRPASGVCQGRPREQNKGCTCCRTLHRHLSSSWYGAPVSAGAGLNRPQ